MVLVQVWKLSFNVNVISNSVTVKIKDFDISIQHNHVPAWNHIFDGACWFTAMSVYQGTGVLIF